VPRFERQPGYSVTPALDFRSHLVGRPVDKFDDARADGVFGRRDVLTVGADGQAVVVRYGYGLSKLSGFRVDREDLFAGTVYV
jgi:hypothetical protein